MSPWTPRSLMRSSLRGDARARFLAKCVRDGACLRWVGATQDMHAWRGNARCERYATCATNMRGHFRLEGKREYAHRAAWRLWVGDIPEGMVVRHDPVRCGNTLCVAVWHLKLGTPAENTADRLNPTPFDS